jgi:hypothetical protein
MSGLVHIDTGMSPSHLRARSPLVRGKHWRTAVLQTEHCKLTDVIESACSQRSPDMCSVSKDLLLKMAAHCDAWTENLAIRDDARQLVGYDTPTFSPNSAQQNTQTYDLMRLSLFDHLVWHLLPDKFPLTSEHSDLSLLTKYQKAADKWQERLYGVMQTLVSVAREKLPQLENDPNLTSSDLPGVLYDRVESLLSAATGSKALANLHSLALGILLYTVRLS